MDDIDRILARHLSGTASPADEAALRRWLDADPANAGLLERLREAWAEAGRLAAASLEESAERYDTAGELERLVERIHAPAREPIPFPATASAAPDTPREPYPWHASPLLRVAAIVALIIGTAVLMSTPHDSFFGASMRAHATGTGERSTLWLRDGSRVVLGPESELRYPARFPRFGREVLLEGTAYFEVAADVERPFRVMAGGTVTQVLGTRFVVRAYGGQDAVEVGVAEGRVAVQGDTARAAPVMVVTGGQVARAEAGAVRLVEDASLDPLFGWTEGRLVFRERPLREVVRELERWYDVEIRIPDPGLAARAITLSFEYAPLDEVLGIIGHALDAEVEREGRIITLQARSAVP